MNTIFLIFLILFCFSGVAKYSKKKPPKIVRISFEDESLKGRVSNPDIFHLFHKKQIKYSRLIKFRNNFLPEMRRTAREIK